MYSRSIHLTLSIRSYAKLNGNKCYDRRPFILVSSFGQTYSRNEIPTKHYAVDSVEEMKMIFPHQDEEEVVRPQEEETEAFPQEEEALPPEDEKAFTPEEAFPPVENDKFPPEEKVAFPHEEEVFHPKHREEVFP